MVESEDYKRLVDKVHSAAKDNKLDLSSDEDLSIAIMNLIGIEEHLFFTAEKTGKDAYFKILNEVREMRKSLLKKIIKDYEGEVWCISKHLLSASMRLIEVGTKHLSKKEDKEAKEMFERAFNLYNLFWALNLKMVDSKTIKDKGIVSEKEIKMAEREDRASFNMTNSKEDKSFFAKIGDVLKTAIDCCKE
ncbi:MAG: hypothetical protein Q8L27_01795 [archaeon]|nr:hypothetical protein [archaeon]